MITKFDIWVSTKYILPKTREKKQKRYTIDADEFTVATLLPVQQFKKSSDAAVWRESRSMI